MSDELTAALREHQAAFGIELSDGQIGSLNAYYGVVMKHNELLHLVSPCTAEEFATRHILESLTLLKHLPQNAKFADVGAGAGLPSIPCLLVREDLKALLIESKEKKTTFLNEAVTALDLEKRAQIVNRQFAEADPAGCSYVTCRALDKFSEKLSRLVRWSDGRKMLLFGGNNLFAKIDEVGLGSSSELMPLSEQRFLFVVG
ncbi:MAG TPA: 16S rRNA (guanine(527)-N(7))-methyltransferase RsmG [Pyrinomonadaceae bacterium]|jgi:16S rRNA (guanine527-N7)-methyltransferase|nr:16S rRNA (guanine(527)-N(7))-methyltransferase RsmG [Pyrinomonadaceae bacterium]